MKKEFETSSLLDELKMMNIKEPKLLDGRYILDDKFRKVIIYATPFREKPYWFIATPTLPVSEREKSRALYVCEDFLFSWSLVENEEHGDKAKAMEALLLRFQPLLANE